MKLRDYEASAVRVLPGLLVAKRRVVLVGPTGSGKTVVGAHTLLEMRGKRVLWLAHRWELLDQARDQLIAAGISKLEIRMFTGTEKSGDEEAWITVASVDMFAKGGHEPPPFDLVVLDEAHRALAASYLRLLAKRPSAMALGLTATPRRLDGKPLSDVFAHMLVMAGPTELIAGHHIASPKTYGIPEKTARAIVKGIRSGAGDYNEDQVARAMMRRRLMGDIVAECARLAPGAPTIVFAVNRRHGRALAKRFTEAGRRTAYLDGDTPGGERRRIIEGLSTGEIEVVVNVDVLSEGFDCPPVKCIALARPTKSITRFLQQCGRGSRPFNGKRPVILDHAGNWVRFGLPHSERDWSLDGEEVDACGDAPVKRCSVCTALMPTGCAKCPECGADQPKEQKEIEEERALLQRLREEERERAAKELILRKLAAQRGLGDAWIQRTMREAS